MFPSASAIADLVKGAVEDLNRDITETIDKVKERVDNLEKNMVENVLSQKLNSTSKPQRCKKI